VDIRTGRTVSTDRQVAWSLCLCVCVCVGPCGHTYRMNCFYRQTGSVVFVYVCLCVCVGPCGHTYRMNCFYRQTGSVVSVYVCLCLCVGQCGHTYRTNCFYRQTSSVVFVYVCLCVCGTMLTYVQDDLFLPTDRERGVCVCVSVCAEQCGHTYRMNCFYQ